MLRTSLRTNSVMAVKCCFFVVVVAGGRNVSEG